MSGLDVDTRSDIYSLGVLPYELLTGTTPLDSERLRSAGFAEMQRLIREEEPPRPSTRVSTLGDSATSVARHRSVDPRRLRQELRGELDWIVMKALEKDRNRRYVSASGLVDDIQRYLRDEPVLACPPSVVYRFEKFARRNKVLLATLAAVALVLVVGAALSAMMASRAMRAERLARERLSGEIQARHDAETAQAAETEQRRVAELERDRADAARQQALAELEHAQVAQQQAESNFQQARAPEPCSTTLLVHRDQALRLWVNQQRIDNDLPGDYATSWHEPLHRLLIDLVAGRNTILVKVASTAATFTARLGDSPRDRIVLLAEQKRCSEAVQAMGDPRISLADLCRAQARPDIGDGAQSRIFDANLPRLWALDEATQSLFEQACADYAGRSDPTLHYKGVIPSLCATRPNPVFEQHQPQYVAYIDEYATTVNQPSAYAFAAFVNYRAGNFDRARELIGSHPSWPGALTQTLLAQSTGDGVRAAEWFASSLAIGTEYADRLRACDRASRAQQQPFAQWADWALYLIVLEEAEQLGNHDEARRWLAQTAWWTEFARSAADRPEAIGPYSIDYHSWLRAHLLYQQAQRLIAP